MTKAKLRVTRIPDANLIQNCLTTQEAMLCNAAMFPDGARYLALLTEALTPFAEATQSVADTTVHLRALVSAKQAQRKKLEAVYRYLGLYVNDMARKNAAAIPAAGLDATNEPRPVYMTRVRGLVVTPSIKERELLVGWNPMRRARIYQVEVCQDTGVWDNWVLKVSTSKARCVLNRDLVSGTKVWVRVRAIGTRNTGAWSQPVCKIVP